MVEFVIRFILGGLVVSGFAVAGDVLRPKSFAGIFGAAPAVALATLGLTFLSKPLSVVATEGRAMMVGAVAFLCYCLLIQWCLRHKVENARVLSVGLWAVWGAVAFGLWAVALR